jgi:4-amino-4-deoxy-L-arabinose transferase-like glycosyltransferase
MKSPLLSDEAAHLILALIIGGYLVLGALYALNTPPWQTPDEPAHYNVIAQIAAEGCCPIISEEDWNAAYLAELTRSQFPPGADLTSVSYEDHQPPLYYLLATPLYTLTGGSLVALRMFSVVLGTGIIGAAYVLGVRLIPHYKVFGLAAAGFVAFVPQHLAILASVNNDSLALLIMAVIMVIAVGYVRNPIERDHDGSMQPLYVAKLPHAAALGGVVGLAYLTKLTVYLPATLVVAVAIISRWRMEGHRVGWFARQTAWAAGLAILLALPLWVRNALTYGFPDIFALGRHGEVVTGQLRTAEYVAESGLATYFSDLLRVTFNSFWGQFGWMAVPLPRREYQLIGGFLLITGLGLGVLLTRYRPKLLWPQKAAMWVLAAAVIGSIINYSVYNTEFVQFQGRYLYPMMLPFALMIASGWAGWALLLRERLPRMVMLLPLAALLWMPLFAVWSLVRHIIPNLA